MKKTYLIISILACSFLSAQVGVNTTSPQEELHVAGSNSTIRIEGLNSPNNSLNLGGNGSSRVFANGNGDLVLGASTENISVLFNPDDYLLSDEDVNSTIVQTGGGSGYEQVGTPKLFGEGLSQFTLTKNAIIEINYAISWRIRKNNPSLLDDGAARIVQTFLVLYKLNAPAGVVSTDLEGNPIVLGGALGLNGQFYSNNNSSDGSSGYFHNTGTDYVSLGPGVYRPLFLAQVAVSNTMGIGAVKIFFGGANDEVQVIAHYYN